MLYKCFTYITHLTCTTALWISLPFPHGKCHQTTQYCVTLPPHLWWSADLCVVMCTPTIPIWAPPTPGIWFHPWDHLGCQGRLLDCVPSFKVPGVIISGSISFAMCYVAVCQSNFPNELLECKYSVWWGMCTPISLSNQLGWGWGYLLLMEDGLLGEGMYASRGQTQRFCPAVALGGPASRDEISYRKQLCFAQMWGGKTDFRVRGLCFIAWLWSFQTGHF